ncbi:AraC family transcriptional regulator [Paenibacillus sp. HWE-109]|uniref:AraC family transcriptional regulator n=1 Tax=Paenibacillus sp. HWE-109 TaxID=1306526 RepID=UPI001EDEC862|nr:AraC family transcriptional regulator [Paenibacillus sp. HWE-109]UKS25447.1 AraC family transcriptional regulator [Paenibacillus sp. HWE-109]
MIPMHLHGDDEIHGDFPHTLKIHHLNSWISPHVHNFIEFTYAIQGQAVEVINGVERVLRPGMFTLLFPYHVHEIRFEPGQELVLYVGAIGLKSFFDHSNSLFSLQGLLSQMEDNWEPSYALDTAAADQIQFLLQHMFQEIRSDQPWNQHLYITKLFEVFAYLDRYRKSQQSSWYKNTANENSHQGMWAIIHYVYQHFREDLSLQGMSARFGYSVPYISTTFKQMTGENYSRFLERIRIAHACNLLLSSEMKIIDIGFEVGFTSYPTFARVFHQRIGKPPTLYRKERR